MTAAASADEVVIASGPFDEFTLSKAKGSGQAEAAWRSSGSA